MLSIKLLFLPLGLLFLSMTSLSAQQQKINTDSLSLVSKISKDQLKLGKLQNKVDQMTRDKHDAATKSQQSADDNSKAAERLSNDPDNKTLARQADNKASDAKSDSRKSRMASDRLDNLNKDILDMQDDISKNQRKLNVYFGAPAAVVMPVPIQPVPIPQQKDTTFHL